MSTAITATTNTQTDTAAAIDKLVARANRALTRFEGYNQELIDHIVDRAATAAREAHADLARLAIEETGRGLFEDKATKNIFAAETVVERMRGLKTVGCIGTDELSGISEIAVPVGVVVALTPVTNPTSTAIFKALLCLKTRNPVIFAFHPSAQQCSIAAARIVRDAAVAAGAPKNAVQWVEVASKEATNLLMHHPGTHLILATGGNKKVLEAYSCGKPAIGVGAGNVPAFVHSTADVPRAINDIVMSKRFDYGMICASEQAAILHEAIYAKAMTQFRRLRAHIATADEKKALEKLLFNTTAGAPGCQEATLNPNVVGHSATEIANWAGFEVPAGTSVIAVEAPLVSRSEPLTREKLCPVLAVVRAGSTEEGIRLAEQMVELDGLGHSAVIHAWDQDVIADFGVRVKAVRIIENAPSSLGGIGGIYNAFRPSLTLGCGSFGRNSISDNVSAMNLVNIKRVGRRNNPVQTLLTPEEICVDPGAVRRLGQCSQYERLTIVTDTATRETGHVDLALRMLHRANATMSVQVVADVPPHPSADFLDETFTDVRGFRPQAVLAIGRGPVMDVAKIVRIRVANPELSLGDLVAGHVGAAANLSKCHLICVPTSTGSRRAVTPLVAVKGHSSERTTQVSDRSYLPDLVVIDTEFVRDEPTRQAAEAGFEILAHATEAYVSARANDFTDALALHALRVGYENARTAASSAESIAALKSRDRLHSAAAMAGLALGNASLGLASALARAVETVTGVYYRSALPIVMPAVVRYNGTVPERLAVWPSYESYLAPRKYDQIIAALGLGRCGPEGSVDSGAQRWAGALERMREQLDLPTGLRDLLPGGLSEQEIIQIAGLAFQTERLPGNPRMPLLADLEELLADCR